MSSPREMPDREAALRKIVAALKPGGIFSVTEAVFDAHYQGRNTVLQRASAVGLLPKEFSGNGLAFTQTLEKPKGDKPHTRKTDLAASAICTSQLSLYHLEI